MIYVYTPRLSLSFGCGLAAGAMSIPLDATHFIWAHQAIDLVSHVP